MKLAKPIGLVDQVEAISNPPPPAAKPVEPKLSAATKDKLEAAKAFIESLHHFPS